MKTWSESEKRELMYMKTVSKQSYSTISDKMGRDEADLKQMYDKLKDHPERYNLSAKDSQKGGSSSPKVEKGVSSNPRKAESTPRRSSRLLEKAKDKEEAKSPQKACSAKKEDSDQEMSPAPETPPRNLRRLRKARSMSPEACSPRRSRAESEDEWTPRTPVAKTKRASSMETPEKKRKVGKFAASEASPAKKSSAQAAAVTPIKRTTHRAPPPPYKDPAGLDPAELAIEGTVRRQVEKLQPLLEEAFKKGHMPKDFSIGTACSGTDAPILGIGLAKESLAELYRDQGARKPQEALNFNHAMSCEIEPFKQAYLARNFKEATIFPDLTKLCPEDGSNNVQTVFGGKAEVPSCWMFVTGTVCKDFSMRKKHRLDLEDKGKSGNTFYAAADYIWKHKPTFTIFENVLNAPWDKMAEFITGRVVVGTVGKGKEGGAVKGGKKSIKSKKTGSDEVPDLLFEVLPGGKLEVIGVPRMAGVKLGQKLLKIENENGKQRVAKDPSFKVGNEMSLEKLKKSLKIKDTDTLIFEAAEKHGFLAHHIKVDTSNFELPHTRNRGYMVVWHKSVGGQDIGALWEELVHGLQSPVQFSLPHYLLSDDDERVRRVREVLRGPMGRRARDENARAWNGDWWNSDSKDVQRQLTFRETHGFSTTHRPMTGWNKDGQRKSQPQLWPELMGVIDSRQCDLMDCFTMDCAAENPPRDALHASYVWDISQNVDMTSSHNKPGVCGCLTPGGWLLFPEHGRCMLGFEKLIVNGIPADRVLLGSETEVQMSDLAGNAMSLPVVLACMLSALAVKEYSLRVKADKNYTYDFNHAAVQKREQRQRQQAEQRPMQSQISYSGAAPALPMFQALAKMADAAEATSILCKCETSGSISEFGILHCSGCGMSICRQCAQMADLSTHSLHDRHLSASRNDDTEKFKRDLRQLAPQKLAFQHEDWGKHDYTLVQVKRDTGRWTLRYLSHDGVDPIAELCVHVGQLAIGASQNGLRCVLRLLNSKDGKAHVVARLMLLPGQDKARWEMQHSSKQKVMRFAGSEPQPSWRAEMTVQEHLKEKWPKIIELDDGSKYERLPCRGTIAQGALWKATDKSSFLYLNPDQDRTGRDNFQFSEYPSYKDADTFTSAKVDSEWAPHKALSESECEVSLVEPVWKALTKLDVYALSDGLVVEHKVPEKSTNEEARKHVTDAPPQKKAKKTAASSHHAQHGVCCPPLVPICTVSGLAPQASQRLLAAQRLADRTGATTLDVSKDSTDLRVSGAGSAQIRRRFFDAVGAPLLRESFSNDFQNWIQLALRDAPWGTDAQCVPKIPKETWNDNQRTYDPQESQEFERQMQTRPEVWKPRMATGDSVEVSVCPEAAAHRAAAAITHGKAQEVTCSWRLIEPSSALESTPGAFKVPTSDDYDQALTPKMFVNGYKLYPRQARALARMQSVEAGDILFSQEERSEHALPGVGWIFEAKAEVNRKLPGGVLADEMGAGKTVTTIALVAAGKEQKTSIPREQHATRASLVMAPPTLIKQWDEERKKFTGNRLKTVVYTQDTTVQEILDADMVIANFELLSQSSYMKNLKTKSGYDGLPDDIPSGSGHKEPERMRGIWVPGHPADVYGSSKGKQKDREAMAFFSSQYAKTIEELRKKKLPPASKNAPLEWFQFQRIVVDEVHIAFCVGDAKEKKEQRAAREMLGVSEPNSDLRPLRARSGIWGLTGTPMLSNEARVTEMGALMGGVYIMGAQQHWRGMERASLRDQFLLAQEPLPSTHYRAQSRAHAQYYVTASCQRNRVEKTDLPPLKIEHQEVQMKSETATVYKQCLADMDCDKDNFAPDFDALPEVVLSKLLDQLAVADERGQELQRIIEQIQLNKGKHVKVTVFAADGVAVDAARKAIMDKGLKVTEFGDTDFDAFAQPDVIEADKAKPRIALLTFDQAAGLNLQHSCSDIVLFAPLYTGSDPVTSCAKEQQAIGRVHRQGQTKNVSVYRIILKGPRRQDTLDTVVLKRNTKEETIKAVTSD